MAQFYLTEATQVRQPVAWINLRPAARDFSQPMLPGKETDVVFLEDL